MNRNLQREVYEFLLFLMVIIDIPLMSLPASSIPSVSLSTSVIADHSFFLVTYHFVLIPVMSWWIVISAVRSIREGQARWLQIIKAIVFATIGLIYMFLPPLQWIGALPP